MVKTKPIDWAKEILPTLNKEFHKDIKENGVSMVAKDSGGRN